jgi:hypothetical protein
MPVLHEYVNRSGYYIKANVNGNVVAFQLTTEGYKKLSGAGISVEKPFSRFLLIDLYKKGDVFTHKSGVIPPEFQQRKGEQLEIEFPPEPEAEKLFPRCSSCSSIKDLHLVEIISAKRSAKILCSECRVNNRTSIDSSIPLYFLTRSNLKHFLTENQFEINDPAVVDYQKLLDMEFEEKWSQLKSKKKLIPGELPGTEPDGRLL